MFNHRQANFDRLGNNRQDKNSSQEIVLDLLGGYETLSTSVMV